MHPKLPPLPVRIVVVLIVISAIVYYSLRSLNNNDNGQLKASGTIESVTVNISPELSGKVKEVLVQESQPIKTGDPLLSLDDSLLATQRAVASAQVDSATAGLHSAQNALTTAKSQYQIVLEAALVQDKNTRIKDWFSDPNQFEQPEWYYTRVEQIQAAQTQVDNAQASLVNAQADLTAITQSPDSADFLNAEKRLLDARLAYLVAKDVNNRAQNSANSGTPERLLESDYCKNPHNRCSGDRQLGEAGRTLFKDAQAELENAQNAYNNLAKTQSEVRIVQARANISVALERYYSALDFLRTLQTGEQSPSVTAAQGAVDQAQAAVDQAQTALAQAEASLALLDAQMKKLTIYAPMDGVILTRNVEPGEFVQPGAVALTMANINELTITIYVPEDRYGAITLNQEADVMVDSFPNETFSGIVIHIADQAEFTPRNVQTVEGRSSTVIAVKLKVTDGEGKLKIGMPADVIFK